ncbi:MAG: hypothetical protein ACOC85_05700 [Thermoplasmatota archaeon]
MSDDYISDLKEMVEDMEEYEEKLDQFYKGLQMLSDKPEKGKELMKDAYEYFEKFSEKHVDEDRKFDSFKETRERLKNYFKNHGIDHRFRDLSKRRYPSYRTRKSRRDSKKDKNEGSTVTTYSFGFDLEPLSIDDIFDAAYAAASGDFSGFSSPESANASDQDAFNDFVDNDLDMSEFKDYV